MRAEGVSCQCRRAGPPASLSFIVDGRERIMESHFNFPMPLTIRCFKCGKVFEVALTNEERHEFPCPGCGEVEVYDLGAMIEKVAATQAKMIRKARGGR